VLLQYEVRISVSYRTQSRIIYDDERGVDLGHRRRSFDRSHYCDRHATHPFLLQTYLFEVGYSSNQHIMVNWTVQF